MPVLRNFGEKLDFEPNKEVNFRVGGQGYELNTPFGRKFHTEQLLFQTFSTPVGRKFHKEQLLFQTFSPKRILGRT